MEYAAAAAYLESLAHLERSGAPAIAAAHFDLRRVEALLARLGDPHRRPFVIHIAGTKGKGSTAAMIASALQAGGYSVGLYTSPHLHTVRERFQVNSVPISQEAFAELATELRPHIETINAEAAYGRLTTFEAWTALAFRHFARAGVDVAVLETGLGGRLDATNVAPAKVCVITSISLDHTQVLGDTLAAIAAEKAGIIKPGATVVTAPQDAEAMAVIDEAARSRGARRLIHVGRDVAWERLGGDLEGQTYAVHGRLGTYRLSLPLLGRHQGENLAVAVAALEAAGEAGVPLPEGALAAGLGAVQWPGRLEVLRRRPLLVVDGAHNPYSIETLAAALADLPHERAHLVFGVSPDKDIPGMIAALGGAFASVTVTAAQGPRAAASDDLVALFAEAGLGAAAAPSVEQALLRALGLAAPDDLVCVTGSLFLVAEARAWLLGIGET